MCICGSTGGHNHAPYPSKSVMQNWQGRDKSLVKNESVGKTFCRTEVRVYALLCKLHHKVNIVSTCSQHHESLPPLPYPPPTYPTNPPHTQAPSPGSDRHGGGPDRWRLRLRAPTDPASPSPPSPGPSRPGGAVAGLGPARRGPRPVAGPSPGSYPGSQCPPPSYMSVLHRRPWAKLPPA